MRLTMLTDCSFDCTFLDDRLKDTVLNLYRNQDFCEMFQKFILKNLWLTLVSYAIYFNLSYLEVV